MPYDDAIYRVVERKWFGLTKKMGGDCAAGYTLGTTDATTQTHVARWYPQGPIRIVKAGSFTICTLNGSGVDKIDCRMKIKSGSASICASFNCFSSAQYTFASDSVISPALHGAGQYVTIKTGTPETDKGTAKNTSTTTGTLAFFIDYVRSFSAPTKWEKM